MRILIFSLVYYPRFVGGAELAVKEITERIPQREVVFEMVTLRSSGEPRHERVGAILMHRVGAPFLPFACNKLLFPFVAYAKARGLHRRDRYDTIWSIMENRAGFAALFFKKKFPDVRFLLTLQEGDDMQYSLRRMGMLVPFLYPLWKQIFRKADRIQAISHYLADWAKYQGTKAPIEVVPNGVDVEKFQVKSFKLKVEEARQKLGLKPEDRVVITTSRLVKKNGIGDLIDAMQYLPESVKLFILGTGNLESNLKRKTSNLQLTGRVAFLGYIAHEKLPEYLHASDIFVRASRSEGLGISFLEAMAAGLPVVATPVGGIPDFLQDTSTREASKATGLFCRVGDPKDIAAKIQLLLTNTELRSRIIENASKMVQERYDWKEIARQMKEVFDKNTPRV